MIKATIIAAIVVLIIRPVLIRITMVKVTIRTVVIGIKMITAAHVLFGFPLMRGERNPSVPLRFSGLSVVDGFRARVF